MKQISILNIPDIHFPLQDDVALNIIIAFIEKVKPDKIMFLGDLIDADQLKSYLKVLNVNSLQEELDQAVAFLERVRGAAGNDTEISFKTGNHDKRIETYLKGKAPELLGLSALKIPNLLQLSREDININYISYNKRYNDGDVIWTHGWHVRQKSGYSGHAGLEVSGRYNGISGHTHRLAKVWRTVYGEKPKYWIESGFLGSMDPDKWEYMDDRNMDWQQGFSVTYMFYDDKDNFLYSDTDIISIHNGRAVYQGEVLVG